MVVEASEPRSKREENGERLLAVSEFEEPLGMHLHDTEIEDGTVKIQLTVGVSTLAADEVVTAWHHTHSVADFGLED